MLISIYQTKSLFDSIYSNWFNGIVKAFLLQINIEFLQPFKYPHFLWPNSGIVNLF